VRVFLVAVAMLVGLANALLYSTVGNSPWGGPFVWRPDPGPLFAAHMLSAVLAGLIVSSALLLFVGRNLRGDYFARYGLMMVAICAGGAILGVFLDTTTTLFDDREPAPEGVSELLFAVTFPAVAGGALGAIEGVALAFPLAWLLGLFREPG
jgi:hypothetical protein